MSLASVNSLASQVSQLSHAGQHFDAVASSLVLRVRRALGVPDRAEPDVEEEFVGLRATLDGFQPEFMQLYGELLLSYLGGDGPVVIPALSNPALQAYLQVARAIDAELQTILSSLVPSIESALTQS